MRHNIHSTSTGGATLVGAVGMIFAGGSGSIPLKPPCRAAVGLAPPSFALSSAAVLTFGPIRGEVGRKGRVAASSHVRLSWCTGGRGRVLGAAVTGLAGS